MQPTRHLLWENTQGSYEAESLVTQNMTLNSSNTAVISRKDGSLITEVMDIITDFHRPPNLGFGGLQSQAPLKTEIKFTVWKHFL